MNINNKKTHTANYRFSEKTKTLLEKIALIESRSMNNVVELLILEKGKQYGLIESRE